MTRQPRDRAASARARLLQRAQVRGEDFQLVLRRFGAERLLFRLAQSRFRDRFILKGAMLYLVWGEDAYRPTRDLDLLGLGPADADQLAACFRELCSIDGAGDGLLFLPETVRTEKIRKEEEYSGVRVLLQARLTEARIDLQVDVGFGDAIVPGPQEVDFPTLLGGPAPRIRAYSRESVVAEKLHAAAQFGDANTRLKDFYDLFSLSTLFSFEGLTLTRAIGATFERRGTPLPESLPLRAAFFAEDARAGRWRAYLARNGLATAQQDFTAVGEALREFLTPPYDALVARVDFLASWLPGGPWR